MGIRQPCVLRGDDYIGGLPEWQQEICREVRRLVHEADPDVEETIKSTNRPYCALLDTRNHVNVMLYVKAIAPNPENIITSGHNNKTARMISVYRDQPINAPALVEMFRHVIAGNRQRRGIRTLLSPALVVLARNLWGTKTRSGGSDRVCQTSGSGS